MLSSEVIADCIAGKEDAIRILVRSHQRSVFQMALSILDRAQAPVSEVTTQAEIATWNTFMVVINRLGRYRPDLPFEVWLYRITVQVTLRRASAWRRERAFQSLWQRFRTIFIRNAPVESPGSGASHPRPDNALWLAICQLNDRLRLPVILRYYHNLSVNQISKILQLSEGVVHARLDAAREKLVAINKSA